MSSNQNEQMMANCGRKLLLYQVKNSPALFQSTDTMVSGLKLPREIAENAFEYGSAIANAAPGSIAPSDEKVDWSIVYPAQVAYIATNNPTFFSNTEECIRLTGMTHEESNWTEQHRESGEFSNAAAAGRGIPSSTVR
jgi:hypothetical protein